MEHDAGTQMPRLQRFLPVLLLALLLPAAGAHAQVTARLVPDPYYRQLAGMTEPLPVATLIHASLVMSGADQPEIARDEPMFETLIAQAKTSVADDGDPYGAGNDLLVFLHDKLFSTYAEPQTRVDVVFDDGQFNCVSSAVIYMIVARAVGLSVGGVSTPDHAFCTVETGKGTIDVETTNRFGFDPGTKRQFEDAFGNTGFSYVPPGNYALRTPTGERGLLSFILQNRMSLLEHQNRFSEAIGIAADRYALLGTQDALDGLTNEIGNLCALLNEQGDYREALDFLGRTFALYGRTPHLNTVASGLVHNIVLGLSKSGAFDQAAAEVQKDAEYVEPQELNELKAMIAQYRLSADLKTEPFQQAVDDVQQSYSDGLIGADSYRSYIVYLYGRQSQVTASTIGYLDAVSVLDTGIKLLSGDAQLEKARAIYLQNYVITIHNAFVDAFNARDYVQARTVLAQGIANAPGNSILAQDQASLAQATRR